MAATVLDLVYSVTVPIPQGQNFVVVSGVAIPFTPLDARGTTSSGSSGNFIEASVDLTTLTVAGATFNLDGSPTDANQTLVATFFGSTNPPPGPTPPQAPNLTKVVFVPIPQGQNWVTVSGLSLSFTPIGASGNTMSGSDGTVIYGTVDATTLTTQGATFNLSAAPTDGNQVLIATFYGVSPITCGPAPGGPCAPCETQPFPSGQPCVPRGPGPCPPALALVADFVPVLRLLLNDLNPTVQEFATSTLTSGVVAVIKLNEAPGYYLSPDQSTVLPAFCNPNAFALISYKTARLFVTGTPSKYSFKSRAFSESIGSYRDFIFDLDRHIYEIENGEMFSGWQMFYGFLSGISGLSLLEVFTTMRVNSPFYSITLTATGGTAAS